MNRALVVVASRGFTAIVSRALLIATIDVTSWDAINVQYMSPAAPFVLIFIAVGIYTGRTRTYIHDAAQERRERQLKPGSDGRCRQRERPQLRLIPRLAESGRSPQPHAVEQTTARRPRLRSAPR